MLLGSEIGAALTALEPLGIDLIGMNCATGPAEMGEHLRYLSQHARVPLSVMPNAGLPVLGADGAEYPLQPGRARRRPVALRRRVRRRAGRRLLRHDAGAPAAGRRGRPRPRRAGPRTPEVEPGAASLYSAVPFAQDAGVLMVGERTNTNGSKAFREAMLAGDWEKVVDIGREAVREGAHLIDLCVDYVGPRRRRRHARGRVPAGHRLDPADHARLDRAPGHRGRPGVPRRPRRHQQRQLRGRRRTGQPLRPGHADRQGARRGGRRAVHRRGGPGPHGAVEGAGRRAAHRHAHRAVGAAPRATSSSTASPSRSAPGRRSRAGTASRRSRRSGCSRSGGPAVGTTLGLSNISFGLKPAARVVLNSVFLHECQKAGLTSAIVHASARSCR